MDNYAGSNILVVDDEHANIFFLEGLLTEEKYSIETAMNGREALEKMVSFNPDLILLDLMMPEMSGLEVLDHMMQDEDLKQIPVIMVTAKTDPEDVELSLNKGAIDYIKKPFDDIELLARVRTSLRIKKNEDKLRAEARSKEEFVSMVSHDLRSPFASISGFADILLQDRKLGKRMSEEHKELLNIIIETSNNLVDYFNRLLNWTRLESGKLKLQKISLSIDSLVRTSSLIFNSRIQEKSIQFQVNIANDQNIEVDEVFFGQVLNNLLSNAIKFTPEGGQLEFNFFQEGEKKYIEVHDSGSGVLNIHLEDLFNPNKHFSTRGTKGEKGSGVGLKICKRIVDAHDFQIGYKQSHLGGSNFYIVVQ